MSNIVSSLNAGSGIDTQKLVKDLVAIERQPVEQRLDKKQTRLEAQISGYGALKSGLSDLQALMKPLGDPLTFSARNVSFTQSTAVTPTKIAANAIPGNYQVEVIELARVQSLTTPAFSDPKAATKTGTLNIRFGSWDAGSFTANPQKAGIQIDINNTNNTLEGVRDAINASNSGIQATIIQEAGQSRLMIASPTGETQALDISVTEDAASPGLSLSMFAYNESEQNLTQNQPASDAVVKINGLELRRPSNDVTDVIPGLEFTLNRSAPGEIINFSITEDKDTGAQAVRDFVQGFNDFLKFASGLTGFSRDDDNQLVKGDLATDSIAKSMVGRIREILISSVPGVTDAQASLAMLGIQTELDGSLSINEAAFTRALNNDFALFGKIFAPEVKSSSPLVQPGLGSFANRAAAGEYLIEITTPPSKGQLLGGVVDAAVAFPFNTGSDDFSFSVKVNGTESGVLRLAANQQFDTPEQFAQELQALINADPAIRRDRAQVDVSFSADGRFELVSREFGSASQVDIVQASAAMSDLGLSQQTGAAGVDVVGTINGEPAFGAGNVLLPNLSSPAYGLNFTIQPGVTEARVNYSRGLTGELNNLINSFLATDGIVGTREQSINRELSAVANDRLRLDDRMDKRLLQLQSQFQAMERIISSFQSTSSQLDGIIDRLPFTAKNR